MPFSCRPVPVLAAALAVLGLSVPAASSHAATFVVTNTADSGAGSFRQAITNANGSAGVDTISFSVGSGFKSIAPLSPLPTITQAVLIDATTQPGFAGVPLIELSGASAGAGANGLTINHAGSSSVFGFVINRFAANGIHVTTAAATIAGNWLGIDAAGTAASPNGSNGLVLLNTTGSSIGGTTASGRNVISGNTVDGIRIEGASGGSNGVYGNYLGTNATGTAAVPNGFNGVVILDSPGNTIGGPGTTYRNVISGNTRNGVGITGPNATGNLVEANVIGTNAAGTAGVGNERNGVFVIDAASNTIGGSVVGTYNVISGNSWNGIHITGAASTGNLVQRNVIGLNLLGTASLPNI
jgi:hypothetical protein